MEIALIPRQVLLNLLHLQVALDSRILVVLNRAVPVSQTPLRLDTVRLRADPAGLLRRALVATLGSGLLTLLQAANVGEVL